jgi:hypothetical protein
MLFDWQDGWDARFANSFAEAPVAPSELPSVAVASDTPLPVIGGVATLEQMQSIYSDTMRSIQSGQTDWEQLAKCQGSS